MAAASTVAYVLTPIGVPADLRRFAPARSRCQSLVSVSGKIAPMAERLTKWAITTGTVIRHMHYGLRVQVPSGEIGVVDRRDIADGGTRPEEWPVVGSVITVLGAGYAGSQLRLSTRASHLEEARRRAPSAESSGSIEPDAPGSGSRVPARCRGRGRVATGRPPATPWSNVVQDRSEVAPPHVFVLCIGPKLDRKCSRFLQSTAEIGRDQQTMTAFCDVSSISLRISAGQS